MAAHVQTERGAHNAIEAGVASVEHAWKLSDADIDLARRNHVVLVSTDFTKSALQAQGMDEKSAATLHAGYVDRLRRAYRAGLPVVFGTDIMFDQPNETRGTLALAELDSFVEAGVPNAVILRAITTDAARLLGIEQSRGTLRPGMAADLIAVPQNPLEHIDALKHAIFVMKDGKVVKPVQ